MTVFYMKCNTRLKWVNWSEPTNNVTQYKTNIMFQILFSTWQNPSPRMITYLFSADSKDLDKNGGEKNNLKKLKLHLSFSLKSTKSFSKF